jgi:hypothetical protein
VRREIRTYLREHGETYTVEALRDGLRRAGYDVSEVDAAIDEWRAEAGNPSGAVGQRRVFDNRARWLHVGAFGLVVVVGLLGTQPAWAVVIAIFCAIGTLIGLGISRAVGRVLLPRTGMTIALLAPAISALFIGFVCIATVNVSAGR